MFVKGIRLVTGAEVEDAAFADLPHAAAAAKEFAFAPPRHDFFSLDAGALKLMV